MKKAIDFIYNRYDYYIIVLIASLAAGGLGGAFQPFRVISFLLFPELVRAIHKHRGWITPFIITIFLFFVYAILSIIWAPVGSEWTAHLAYCIFHFLLFIEIVAFSFCANKPFAALSTGWLVAVALTLVVAMWEITTDNHLSISKQQSNEQVNLGYTIFIRQFASVTFFNYNSYVTFLCFAMPFLFYVLLMKGRGTIWKGWSILSLVLSAVCILFNASRGGLITMMTMAAIYFLMSLKNRRAGFSILLIIAGALLAISYFGDSLFTMMEVRSSEGALFEGGSRYEIWEHAMNVFFSTYGMGTGLGGIIVEMNREWRGIPVTHNIFLEILLEFGIIIFVAFIFYLVRLFKNARRFAGRDEKITVFLAILALPIYGIIDSGYLSHPHVFAAFASLSVFTNMNIIKKTRR